jgi:hypothetical protein
MLKEVTQILDFMVEIEKLKGVLRKSRPVGLKRHENSGEHSWHVCISALMLKDYADETINIDRVIKMLLIHDLGEIDAGDKIVYESETAEQKNKEWKGVNEYSIYCQTNKVKNIWHCGKNLNLVKVPMQNMQKPSTASLRFSTTSMTMATVGRSTIFLKRRFSTSTSKESQLVERRYGKASKLNYNKLSPMGF